jgi:hypothetical protein
MASERDNDVVHYWQNENGKWYWHRIAPNNEILSNGEGYEDEGYCIEIATALNPGVEVKPEPTE